ncbi:MAG: phosphatase PAP2 family protein [Verrucomicrobiota bacterium]
MKKTFLLGLLFILTFILPTLSKESTEKAPPLYLQPESIALAQILPPPPEENSAKTKDDLASVLDHQKNRTPLEVARAKSEVKLKVFVFSDVIGSWFIDKNLPLTARFFDSINNDSHFISESAKKTWNRPRPPVNHPQITPAVELENNSSYPSGHSTRGTLYALILADLFPHLKEKLFARGRQIGDDRVIAGAHYPSDVEAGRVLGQALYVKLSENPKFKSDLENVREEIEAASKK